MFRKSLLLATACALLAAGSAAHGQQIITAVESDFDGNDPSDTRLGTTAGQLLGTTFGGADTRALTDFGVNKIYARGNDDYEQYATSAWLDTFTVGGATGSRVTVNFTVSVDGMADYTGTDGEFDFNIYALRGGNWAMSGYAQSPDYFSPGQSGNDHDRLLITQTVANRVTQADLRDFEGFWNYTNSNGQAGNFQSHVTYFEAGDYFSVENVNQQGIIETRLYATGFVRFVNGVPQAPGFVPYTAAPPFGQQRAALQANYSLLDSAMLCGDGGCGPGNYPGTDLTLSFELAAGSTFTLASFLYADDLREGTIDFFNTARVSNVSVSAGGSLTSLSGALVQNPDGTYGYPAANAAVPEPASWALMIAGFALAGTAARRRARPGVTYA